MSDSASEPGWKALLRAVEEVRRDGLQPGDAGDAAVAEAELAPLLPREPRPGDVFGAFTVLRQRASGGMAAVYEAEAQEGGRVALKVLHPGRAASPRSRERFVREAATLGRLNHPGIIRVLGSGTARGLPFYAMELLPGPDLAQVLQALRRALSERKPFVVVDHAAGQARPAGPGGAPPADGSRIEVASAAGWFLPRLAEAAEALHFAHEQHVLHRDIKPANLVLSAAGRLVLTDFGIAKPLAEDSLTRTGDFLGSPAYLSPEQALVRRVQVDHRTDVYSLGVTLFECLSLQQPFVTRSLGATLRAVLAARPPRLRSLDVRIAPEVEAVVACAVEKDPDRRFGSAAELAAELRRISRGQAIRTPLLPPLRVRGRTASWWLAAAGVALLLAGAWALLRPPAGRTAAALLAGIPLPAPAAEAGDWKTAQRRLRRLAAALGAARTAGAGPARYGAVLLESELAVIRAAEEQLPRLRENDAAPVLETLGGLTDSPHPAAAQNAAVVLARLGGSQAVPILQRALELQAARPGRSGPEQERVVTELVAGLVVADREAALPALASVAGSEKVAVRLAVARALAGMAGSRARALRRSLLAREEAPSVRGVLEQ